MSSALGPPPDMTTNLYSSLEGVIQAEKKKGAKGDKDLTKINLNSLQQKDIQKIAEKIVLKQDESGNVSFIKKPEISWGKFFKRLFTFGFASKGIKEDTNYGQAIASVRAVLNGPQPDDGDYQKKQKLSNIVNAIIQKVDKGKANPIVLGEMQVTVGEGRGKDGGKTAQAVKSVLEPLHSISISDGIEHISEAPLPPTVQKSREFTKPAPLAIHPDAGEAIEIQKSPKEALTPKDKAKEEPSSPKESAKSASELSGATGELQSPKEQTPQDLTLDVEAASGDKVADTTEDTSTKHATKELHEPTITEPSDSDEEPIPHYEIPQAPPGEPPGAPLFSEEVEQHTTISKTPTPTPAPRPKLEGAGDLFAAIRAKRKDKEKGEESVGSADSNADGTEKTASDVSTETPPVKKPQPTGPIIKPALGQLGLLEAIQQGTKLKKASDRQLGEPLSEKNIQQEAEKILTDLQASKKLAGSEVENIESQIEALTQSLSKLSIETELPTNYDENATIINNALQLSDNIDEAYTQLTRKEAVTGTTPTEDGTADTLQEKINALNLLLDKYLSNAGIESTDSRPATSGEEIANLPEVSARESPSEEEIEPITDISLKTVTSIASTQSKEILASLATIKLNKTALKAIRTSIIEANRKASKLKENMNSNDELKKAKDLVEQSKEHAKIAQDLEKAKESLQTNQDKATKITEQITSISTLSESVNTDNVTATKNQKKEELRKALDAVKSEKGGTQQTTLTRHLEGFRTAVEDEDDAVEDEDDIGVESETTISSDELKTNLTKQLASFRTEITKFTAIQSKSQDVNREGDADKTIGDSSQTTPSEPFESVKLDSEISSREGVDKLSTPSIEVTAGTAVISKDFFQRFEKFISDLEYANLTDFEKSKLMEPAKKLLSEFSRNKSVIEKIENLTAELGTCTTKESVTAFITNLNNQNIPSASKNQIIGKASGKLALLKQEADTLKMSDTIRSRISHFIREDDPDDEDWESPKVKATKTQLEKAPFTQETAQQTKEQVPSTVTESLSTQTIVTHPESTATSEKIQPSGIKSPPDIPKETQHQEATTAQPTSTIKPTPQSQPIKKPVTMTQPGAVPLAKRQQQPSIGKVPPTKPLSAQKTATIREDLTKEKPSTSDSEANSEQPTTKQMKDIPLEQLSAAETIHVSEKVAQDSVPITKATAIHEAPPSTQQEAQEQHAINLETITTHIETPPESATTKEQQTSTTATFSTPTQSPEHEQQEAAKKTPTPEKPYETIEATQSTEEQVRTTVQSEPTPITTTLTDESLPKSDELTAKPQQGSPEEGTTTETPAKSTESTTAQTVALETGVSIEPGIAETEQEPSTITASQTPAPSPELGQQETTTPTEKPSEKATAKQLTEEQVGTTVQSEPTQITTTLADKVTPISEAKPAQQTSTIETRPIITESPEPIEPKGAAEAGLTPKTLDTSITNEKITTPEAEPHAKSKTTATHGEKPAETAPTEQESSTTTASQTPAPSPKPEQQETTTLTEKPSETIATTQSTAAQVTTRVEKSIPTQATANLANKGLPKSEKSAAKPQQPSVQSRTVQIKTKQNQPEKPASQSVKNQRPPQAKIPPPPPKEPLKTPTTTLTTEQPSKLETPEPRKEATVESTAATTSITTPELSPLEATVKSLYTKISDLQTPQFQGFLRIAFPIAMDFMSDIQQSLEKPKNLNELQHYESGINFLTDLKNQLPEDFLTNFLRYTQEHQDENPESLMQNYFTTKSEKDLFPSVWQKIEPKGSIIGKNPKSLLQDCVKPDGKSNYWKKILDLQATYKESIDALRADPQNYASIIRQLQEFCTRCLHTSTKNFQHLETLLEGYAGSTKDQMDNTTKNRIRGELTNHLDQVKNTIKGEGTKLTIDIQTAQKNLRQANSPPAKTK